LRRTRPSPDPGGADRLLGEAGAHYAGGRLDAAAALYRRGGRLYPTDFRIPYSLGVVELARGRPEAALGALRRVVEVAPDHALAWRNLAAAAQTLGRWQEAADAYRAALRGLPDSAETRQALAIALAVLGRTDEALAEHRILAAAPATRLWALTRIALIRPAAIDDAALVDMRLGAEGGGQPVETRIGLLFALGEALEARELVEEAFAAFAAGNRLKRAELATTAPPEAVARANEAAAVEVTRRFTPQFVAERAGQGMRTDRPIFIVGMPRSGSTLIEQILASHPEVQGLGETGALSGLLEGRYPEALDRAALRNLADRYLEAMRRQGWDGASRFIDKTLENYVHVGLIALMFPNALILESVRDPMDTCLACFRQLFTGGDETLYDLADIGAEYRRYRRLMDHWRRVLPGRVAAVDYDALVARPEAGIRRLVTVEAALPWNEACLRFFEREGPVTTASASQVRLPISSASQQRWRRYETHLGPLIEALEEYGPRSA
jgi:hypothetical protein